MSATKALALAVLILMTSAVSEARTFYASTFKLVYRYTNGYHGYSEDALVLEGAARYGTDNGGCILIFAQGQEPCQLSQGYGYFAIQVSSEQMEDLFNKYARKSKQYSARTQELVLSAARSFERRKISINIPVGGYGGFYRSQEVQYHDDNPWDSVHGTSTASQAQSQ